MARKVFKSARSREDTLAVWDYIAYGNLTSGDPTAADRVIDAIERTYLHLAEFPHKTRIWTGFA